MTFTQIEVLKNWVHFPTISLPPLALKGTKKPVQQTNWPMEKEELSWENMQQGGVVVSTIASQQGGCRFEMLYKKKRGKTVGSG